MSSSEEEIVRTKKYFVGKENVVPAPSTSPKKRKERRAHKVDRWQELEKYQSHRETRKSVPFAERKPHDIRNNEEGVEGGIEEEKANLGKSEDVDDVTINEPSFHCSESEIQKASFYLSDERGYVVIPPSPTSSDIEDPTLHFSDW